MMPLCCVLAGDQVAAVAKYGDMTIESAREHLRSSGYVCSKARVVAAHIANVHPDRPIIVVCSSIMLGSHFVAALGQSAGRKLYMYGCQDDGEQLTGFKRDAKPFARGSLQVPPAGTAPPVLLASHEVVGTGIDGLQVGSDYVSPECSPLCMSVYPSRSSDCQPLVATLTVTSLSRVPAPPSAAVCVWCIAMLV